MLIHTPDTASKWYEELKPEYHKPYYIKMWRRIYNDMAKSRVLPDFGNVFRALNELDPENIRVIILGQDPYPTFGKAIGRSFGVPKDYHKINSSLLNILNEVSSDIGKPVKDISFQQWAKQGVLMLNTRLTVVEGQPMSHAGIGWETFIDCVLDVLNNVYRPGVVMLWGTEAKKLRKKLSAWHALETSHPCKFSAHRGFIGCKHFSKTNKELVKRGLKPIEWA